MRPATIWTLTLLPAAALVAFAGLAASGQLLPAVPSLAASQPVGTGATATGGTTADAAAAGPAPRGDVDAAVKALTVNDAGEPGQALRWEQPQVAVRVDGDADARQLAAIDEVLTWLSQASGVAFRRVGDGPGEVRVTLGAGRPPRAQLHSDGQALTQVAVQWDPDHYHADRWMWEELLHAAGPYGDWGPDGAVVAVDQTAARASDFDRWLLEGLYGADTLDAAGLRASLTDRLPPGR